MACVASGEEGNSGSGTGWGASFVAHERCNQCPRALHVSLVECLEREGEVLLV